MASRSDQRERLSSSAREREPEVRPRTPRCARDSAPRNNRRYFFVEELVVVPVDLLEVEPELVDEPVAGVVVVALVDDGFGAPIEVVLDVLV